jgi:hypothetical protein
VAPPGPAENVCVSSLISNASKRCRSIMPEKNASVANGKTCTLAWVDVSGFDARQ